jgi:hypothetical protein
LYKMDDPNHVVRCFLHREEEGADHHVRVTS